jgi:hypothetical protein
MRIRWRHRVSFTDQRLRHRVGLIVRIATLDCEGQTRRAGLRLLRPLVEISTGPPSTTALVGQSSNGME